MDNRPQPYTPEVKKRAVAYAMERLDRYKSVSAASADIAPELNIGKETLRRWVLQAQVDAGDRAGPTSEVLSEIKAYEKTGRPKSEVLYRRRRMRV
ncbi:hypothetical protein ACTXJE_08425 [Glutamicibacter ardleyensis]